MSSRSWQERIENILNSIAAIQSRTCNLSFAEFKQNETVVKAVLFDFIIIGEATRNIPLEIQTIAPSIPWRLMGDMRNVMTSTSRWIYRLYGMEFKKTYPLL